MALLEDFDAFYLEHRLCGELRSAVSERAPWWVTMDCSCGARFARAVTEPDDPPWRRA